ncbi:MAG: peptidoglycan DD-metalloendopeptidase family protein [Bacteroidales bacterium]|nr:peptidoglycan DD-metalloendopeptidase family protein [Bacteroidales bacterium]MDD3664487.1 peptidoglycan DD-metalloendopeptidase family protein [Bacteroidales bacterium]
MKRPLIEIFVLALAGILLVVAANWIFYTGRQIDELVGSRQPFVPEPELEYGIEVDSLHVEKGQIKLGQNLSTLLGGYGMTPRAVDKLVKKCDGVFDLRRIKAGQPYTIMTLRDSSKSLQYFVYEDSPLSYVIFDLRDTLSVAFGEREVLVSTSQAFGTIQSSLWNALASTSDGVALASAMEGVYGWVIDFFGLQRGDSFKLLYESLSVEGKQVGTGKILAASFTTQGKTYQAFHFQNDSLGVSADYFDETGQSLRRAFLKSPMKFSRISSRFSARRYHPVLKIYRPHHGVDYAAPTGTPVFTIGAGTVAEVGFQRSGAGRYLKIRHNSVYTTVYMHLNGYAKGIKNGVKVNQGDLIGYVGRTGLATGPHLDFRVYKNGKPIDPLKMESPPAKPIPTECLAVYKNAILPLVEQLNALEENQTEGKISKQPLR